MFYPHMVFNAILAHRIANVKQNYSFSVTETKFFQFIIKTI